MITPMRWYSRNAELEAERQRLEQEATRISQSRQSPSAAAQAGSALAAIAAARLDPVGRFETGLAGEAVA